jgi:hypothetical protein
MLSCHPCASSVVVAVGSPQGAGAQPAQPDDGSRPSAASPQGSCETACAQIARCKIQSYQACLQACRRDAVDRQPDGSYRLGLVADANCERLRAVRKNGAKPPVPAAAPAASAMNPAAPAQARGSKRLWQCWAMGSWKRSCKLGEFCPTRTQSSFGFGENEMLARTSAETQCTRAMTGLIVASFGGSTVMPCKATSCKPP